MTVVNALLFNKTEGAIIADEMQSNHLRKYESCTKLHSYSHPTGSAVVGTTGISYILTEGMKLLELAISGQAIGGRRPIAETLAEIASNQAWTNIHNKFNANTGFPIEELQAGTFMVPPGKEVPFSKEWLQFSYYTLMNIKQEQFTAQYLVMEKDMLGINLSLVMPSEGTPLPWPDPYCSVGSGSDLAEHVLGTFVTPMKPIQRENINKIEGLSRLIHATNVATKYNLGVGGTPTIGMIEDDRPIYFFDDDHAKLAAEHVELNEHGIISKKNMYAGLEKIFFTDEDIDPIEEEMFMACGKKFKKALRVLRDFRI